MNLDVQLSPHFSLREMVVTAHRYIDNTPSPETVERLRELCGDYLEHIREQFGPLIITSGYRCPQLNTAIGGSKSSAHPYGCAGDFVPRYQIPTAQIVNWVAAQSGLDFDQVIDEYSSTANWVHLGILRPIGGRTPRKQALAMRDGKYSVFA
jgi:hypothetical protein